MRQRHGILIAHSHSPPSQCLSHPAPAKNGRQMLAWELDCTFRASVRRQLERWPVSKEVDSSTLVSPGSQFGLPLQHYNLVLSLGCPFWLPFTALAHPLRWRYEAHSSSSIALAHPLSRHNQYAAAMKMPASGIRVWLPFPTPWSLTRPRNENVRGMESPASWSLFWPLPNAIASDTPGQ
jgi:hypothetical protein